MAPGDLVEVNPKMAASHVGLCPLPDQWSNFPAVTWVEEHRPVLLLAIAHGWALVLNNDGKYGWAEQENWVRVP